MFFYWFSSASLNQYGSHLPLTRDLTSTLQIATTYTIEQVSEKDNPNITMLDGL